MKKILSIAFLLYSTVNAQVINPSRTTDWYVAGHEGPIPSPVNFIDVTTFGAVGDSLTNNYTSIVNAINSLSGSSGVIYFPPGNYIIQSPLNLPDSVIIRGASSDSTHLIFNFNSAVGNSFNISGPGSSAFVNVLAGYAKGSSAIRVGNATGFAAGDYAEIQEDNGTWDTQPVSWANQSIGQILRIDSVVGDTLFFHQPLRITYDSTKNVGVNKFTPRKEVGIECLSVERQDSLAPSVNIGIYFYHAVNCWVRGVESRKSIGSHFEADNSSHIEIRGCYVHHSYVYDGSSTHGYGITLFKHTCECRLENNVMRFLRHSFSLQCGANGNVIGYNYSLEPNRSEFPSNLGADISLHGHYSFSNLFEGNIVQNIQIDQTWGPSGPYNTFFRNRAELYGILMSSGTMQSDSQNFVGNEITNATPPYGNYMLAGAGHFEWGNNIHGTITPTGTTTLNDSSYYLTSPPAFWNIAYPWPSVGEPNVLNAGTIPAKVRYISTDSKTVCTDQSTVSINENVSENIKVYPNPVLNELKIENGSTSSPTGKLKVDNIAVHDVLGNLIKSISKPQANISLNVSDLSSGIYFLKIDCGNAFITKKFIKQ
jgi:hypothetical protein